MLKRIGLGKVSLTFILRNMSSPAMRNITYLATPLKSPVLTLVQSNTSRCLFTPQKHSMQTDNLVVCHKSRKTNHSAVPSFDTPHRKLVPTNQLKEYLEEFVLGRGSYGVVVRGRYKNKNVAVKVVKKLNENSSQSLIREMNALKLKHPNIVQMNHVENCNEMNIGFVFMELFNHKNLENLLKEAILPLKIKIKYLKDVASALEYCHNNGVLHLDVKPKNIIVNTDENACKLCDFGSSSSKDNITSELKAIVTGTLKYSAPEILRGEQATEKADIYSYGITMWQLLNEMEPYDKEDLHVIIYKVVTQNYRPEYVETESKHSLSDIFVACWDSKPSKRPSSADIIRSLKEINLK